MTPAGWKSQTRLFVSLFALSACITGRITNVHTKKSKYAVKVSGQSKGRKSGNIRQSTEPLQRSNVMSGSTHGHSRPVEVNFPKKDDQSYQELHSGSEPKTAWLSTVDSVYAARQRQSSSCLRSSWIIFLRFFLLNPLVGSMSASV